jgi:Fe-S-cluster-containing dehydrogenase component
VPRLKLTSPELTATADPELGDMCYDRTSTGRKPMCATVCPSQALFFGPREEVERMRKRSRIVNEFQFGEQTITTKVNMVVPAAAGVGRVDVTHAMHEPPTGRTVGLNILEPVGTGP